VLVRGLLGGLRGILFLLDHGFYEFELFRRLLLRNIHFVVPAASNSYFQVLSQLGPGDYLCEVIDRRHHQTLKVRVVYVYRRGFRRKRLVTSLLDPRRYPADELAALYHLRWTIETFFRDFKHTLQGARWHCRTPETFQAELVAKMALVCLVRIPGCQAAVLKGIRPGCISFAATLTAVRRFMRSIVLRRGWASFREAWQNLVHKVAGYILAERPGRMYPRDRQEYRRLARDRRRRPPAPTPDLEQGPETKIVNVRKYAGTDGYTVTVLLS
jgi:hypothetical protein